MSYYDLNKDVISHHGVKGMKWGVQRVAAYAKGDDVGEAGSGGGDDNRPEDQVAEGPNGGISVAGKNGFTDVTKLSDLGKLDDKQTEAVITVIGENTVDKVKDKISAGKKFLAKLFG